MIDRDLIQEIQNAFCDSRKATILLNPIMKGSMANLRKFVDTLYETKPSQGHVARLFGLEYPTSEGQFINKKILVEKYLV